MDSYRGRSTENPHMEQANVTAPAADNHNGFNEFVSGYFVRDYSHFNQASTAHRSSADEPLYPSNQYQQNPQPSRQPVRQGHQYSHKPPGNSFQTSHHTSQGPHSGWQAKQQATAGHQQNQRPDEHISCDPFHNIWSVGSSGMTSADISQDLLKPGGWLQASQSSNRPHYQVPHSRAPAFGDFSQGPGRVEVNPSSLPPYSWSTSDGVTDSNISEAPNLKWDQSMYTTVQYPNIHARARDISGQKDVNEWELPSDEFHRKMMEADSRGRQERRHWKKTGMVFPNMPAKSGKKQQRPVAKGAETVASFLERYRGKELPHVSSDSSLEIDNTEQNQDQARISNVNCQINLEADAEIKSNVVEHIQASGVGEKSSQLPTRDFQSLSYHVRNTSHHAENGSDFLNGTGPDHTEIYVTNRENSLTTADPNEEDVDCQDILHEDGHFEFSDGRQARSNSDPVTAKENLQINTKNPAARKTVSNGKIRPGKRKHKASREKRRSTSMTLPKSDPTLSSKQPEQGALKMQPPQKNAVSDQLLHLNTDSKMSSTNPDDSMDHVTQTEQFSNGLPCNKGGLLTSAGMPEAVSSLNKASPDSHSDCDGTTCSDECLCGNCGIQWIPVNEPLTESTDAAASKDNLCFLGSDQASTEDDSCKDHSSVAVPCLAVPPQDTCREVHDGPRSGAKWETKESKIETCGSDDDQDNAKQVFKMLERKGQQTKEHKAQKKTASPASGQKVPDASTASISKAQEKKPPKESGVFFDPKRIFGGHKVSRTPDVHKKTGSALQDKNSSKQSTRKNTVVDSTPVKTSVHAEKRRVHSTAGQHNVSKGEKQHKSSVDAMYRLSMNGSLPNKPTAFLHNQFVPSWSKETLTRETTAEDSLGKEEDASLRSPKRTSLPYSFKRDERTGVLKSSDLQDGMANSSIRDLSGDGSVHGDPKGERRCSGDSHMEGFHHPMGCSADCYMRTSVNGRTNASQFSKASSTPSAAKEAPKAASKSNSSSFQRTERLNRKHDSAMPSTNSKEKLSTPRVAKEEQKQMPSQRPEKHEKPSEKQQANGSQKRFPTRATYSQPKVPPAKEDKEKRPKQSAKPHSTKNSPPSSESRRATSAGSASSSHESRHQGTPDSDAEDIIPGDLDSNDWWLKTGKKIAKGLYWLVLFVALLCLVLLSFVLALLKDVLKFIYCKGKERWAAYKGESSYQGGGWGTGRGDADSEGSRWWSNGGSAGGPGGQGHQSTGPRSNPQRQRVKRMENIELPTTEDAAVKRILTSDPNDLYEVVGVADRASEDEIKRYYRKQCMLVHPDKTNQPRANEAFQILQKAYATLSDEAKRREYEAELYYKEEMEEKVEEFFAKMKEMSNMMACGECEGMHKRYETDLPTYAARYCAHHNERHSVGDGALWKETGNFGFKIYVYLCDGSKVYDVTEWAACQNLEWMKANSCQLQCHIKKPGHRQQQQQPSQGYQDVFDNVFGSGAYRQFQDAANQQGHQGNSSQGNTATGGNSGGHGGHRPKPPGAGRNHYNRTKKSRKRKK